MYGSRFLASTETGCFFMPKPSMRRSMITIAPNIMVNARMWMVSITGKAQMVPEIAWPSQVLSFHTKNGFRACHILEVISSSTACDDHNAPTDQRDPAGQFRGPRRIFRPLPFMHAAVDLGRVKDQHVQPCQEQEQHFQAEPDAVVALDWFRPEQQGPGDDHHQKSSRRPGNELVKHIGGRLFLKDQTHHAEIGDSDGSS